MMRRRLFAMFGTPFLALSAATIYTEWRAGQAEIEIASFCSSIPSGIPLTEFARRGLTAGFEVHDQGANSSSLMASKTVYALHKEVYTCRAERDPEGHVRSTRTEHEQS